MSQYLTLLIYAAYPRFPSHPSKLCTLHINLIHLASIFDLMFRTLLLCPEIANEGGRRWNETVSGHEMTRFMNYQGIHLISGLLKDQLCHHLSLFRRKIHFHVMSPVSAASPTVQTVICLCKP